MTTRRRFLALLAAGIVIVPRAAVSQSASRIYRIGFLGARFRSTPERPDVQYDEWLKAMRQLGYVEGRNVVIEWRFAENKFERLPELAAELATMKPDVIVTHGLAPTLALKKATSTIPIVFAAMVDPVGNRVVPSLAHPGGNITGFSVMSSDISAKRVEFLKQMIPLLTRVAILVNLGTPAHSAMLESSKDAARVLGVGVLPVEARNQREIEQALATLADEQVKALIILDDPTFNGYTGAIGRSLLSHRISAMCPTPEYVESGGLACYGVSIVARYRRAALLVDRILKGANPADLPIEQPTKLDLVINRKTAKALGLTIPPEILVLADRVIE